MYNIIEYEKLNSTNKFALENIKNLSSDTVIRAKIQTSGRGRFSRKWISDKENNCYMSFVLNPDIIYRENFANLTQYLSVILCRLLKKYGVIAAIKWPNDVLVNGKKIAGILSEIAFGDNNLCGIVLGIGVNLNLEQDDLSKIDIPATSLNLETEKNVDSSVFIKSLVQEFYKNYDEVLKDGFPAFRAEYISYCNFIGQNITIKNPEPTSLGVAIGVTKNGSLEIINNSGEKQVIISGDVILQ